MDEKDTENKELMRKLVAEFEGGRVKQDEIELLNRKLLEL
jgi:hypothetical protein